MRSLQQTCKQVEASELHLYIYIYIYMYIYIYIYGVHWLKQVCSPLFFAVACIAFFEKFCNKLLLLSVLLQDFSNKKDHEVMILHCYMQP